MSACRIAAVHRSSIHDTKRNFKNGEIERRRQFRHYKILFEKMKKYIIVIILIATVYSCSSDHSKKLSEIENIPVELHNISSDASSFIEKIEIVPLETTDSSLIASHKKTIYNKVMDIYAIYGKDQIVLTFTGDGKFIASSKGLKGEGPQEYYMAVDIKFNPYLHGIDFFNPYGVIYTYTPTFDLISVRKIKPEFYFDALMALNVNDYVFNIPSIWVDQEVAFGNLETQKINMADYSGTISSSNTMDKECFYSNGGNFYFVPRGINYYFYRIDEKNKKIIPIIYLDFDDAEIKENNLPGNAVGKRTGTEITKTDKEKDNLMKGIQDRGQYIRDNNLIASLIKFFNDDYIYIYFAKGKEGYGGHYIYNRKKKEGFLLNDGKPFIMQPCFCIVDNVLMAICDAYYVSKLVDVNLMSAKEKDKMKQLKEDDNPVIIKYYLQK